jgi:hypothetical protein
MLAAEAAVTGRPDRGPPVEAWALPQRPFMLRRDRHTPRWAQQRGVVSEPRVAATAQAAPLAAMESADEPRARPVPIEAGPPPAHEPASIEPAAIETVEEPVAMSPTPMADETTPSDTPVEPSPVIAEAEAMPEPPPVAVPADVKPDQSVLDLQQSAMTSEAKAPDESVAPAEPEPGPVPANDVVAGPVVQPIVIGSESAPPIERKRGWWRRR